MVMVSRAMEPTIFSGAEVHVDKGAFSDGVPVRNDVVVWLDPDRNEANVKRVVGLPGETIEYVNCVLSIDGAVVEESFLPDEARTVCGMDVPTMTIPDGSVFLMGDNRAGSRDSREVGAVGHSTIVGKVVEWRNAAGNWVRIEP